MKWVVGAVAVLVALVMGIALGWMLRGRAPDRVVYTPAPPTATPTPIPTPTIVAVPPPPTATAKTPTLWVEDKELFAWPSSASSDVVVVDATHYLVRRSYTEHLLANNALASPRLVPSYEDGGVNGVKLFGVRPDSGASKLGLQNGDRLETLNGASFADPDDALSAYTHMHTAKKLVLGLNRRGSHLDLHYRILD